MNMSDDSTADTSLTINDDDLVVVEDLPEEETSDVEEQVHDQLPTVDEVKTNVSYKPAGNPSLKRTICAGVAFLLLVVGITLLVVFVPKSRKSGSSASYEPTSRQEDVIQLLLHNAITPEPALRDRYSAQSRAVQFIADGDSYQMAINEDTVEKFVERYVLAVFYYHFSGSTWTYKLNFMTSQDHCNWFQRFTTIAGDTLREGVMCNDKGHVTTVMLAMNGLKGENFPDELRWLGQLDTLHFQYNAGITGEFPKGLKYMPNMKSVALHYCSLRGMFPLWIGDLTGLTTLALGNNQFEGEVPASISSLSKLKFLALDDNAGLTGNIQLFKTMTQLETLYLEGNTFDGNINGILEAMPKLVEFDISDNMINGEVPTALMNHKKLAVVDMHDNYFGGAFPNDIFKNTNLQFLALHHNHMTGIIPDRIGFLENMKHLDLSFNKLTGIIPDDLGSLTELRYLQTSGNNFTPHTMQEMDFSKLSNLHELAMKDNNLKGKIPDYIGEFSNLQLLDLDANQLTGKIPSWIGVLQGLDHLLLNRNKLTGTLPSQLGNLKELNVLLLDGNSISGNANVVCSNFEPTFFISDCKPDVNSGAPEIQCNCCTACCEDSDTECNNGRWTSNVDPKWEYGYVRSKYTFSLDNAPAQYAKGGEDDGGPVDPLAP